MAVGGYIGSEAFAIWQGGVDSTMGMELRPIVRPNVDGVAVKQLAVRPKPFEVRTLSDVTSAAALKTLKTTLAALVGTLQTVVDGWQNSYSKVAVLGVTFESEGKAVAISGSINGGPFYLWARWTLLVTEIPT